MFRCLYVQMCNNVSNVPRQLLHGCRGFSLGVVLL